MPGSHGIGNASIASLVLAALAASFLIVVLSRRIRDGLQSTKIHFAFWSSLIVLALYLGAIINKLFVSSPLFMVGWPILGIVLTGCGLAWPTSAPAEERKKLAYSNILLLAVSILSIVAPN